MVGRRGRRAVPAAILTLVLAATGLAFTARPAPAYPASTVQFVGHGWGHGRGMGQWGALGYAAAGWSYGQILDHFYGGTSMSALPAGATVTVRLTRFDGAATAVTQRNGQVSSPAAPGQAFGAMQASRNGPGTFALFGAAGCGGPWTALGTVAGPVAFSVPTPADTTSTDDLLAVCQADGSLRYVRGSVSAVDDNGTQRTVDTLPVEQYARGVVPEESPAAWGTQYGGRGMEELKAQAVAVRSYALSANVYGYAQTCDSTACQVYGGVKVRTTGGSVVPVEQAASDAAVAASAGQVRRFASGTIARTEFSASTGGWTAGGAFRAVVDDGDALAANVHHTWSAAVPVATVQAAYPSIGTLVDIVATRRNGFGDWGGRVLTVEIRGTTGTVTTTGDALRGTLGLQSGWWTVVRPGDPIGSLDAVTAGYGSVTVGGWALDPDTTDPVAVHVYVDGVFGMALAANAPRPDVAAAYPGFGLNHGFNGTLAVTPGPHQVCAYAINGASSPGANATLGCRSVTVPAGNPIGSVDGAAGRPGAVVVAGWALDPDTPASIAVHVYVDGAFGTAVAADAYRPDVGAAYPGYGAAHGFNATVPVGPGPHQVCAYGIDRAGTGVNALVACRLVVVPGGPPFGSLDAAVGQSGRVAVGGWAIDPDTAVSIPVHLYVDGRWGGVVAAADGRPDVAAAFPGYGAAHGFNGVLVVPAGAHQVCAWGIDVQGGEANSQIGCRTVTVPT